MTTSPFRVLSAEPEPNERPNPNPGPTPTRDPHEQAVAIQMLQMALAALWQRFSIAVGELFLLLAGASVFTLYLFAPPDPTIKQLVMLGLYSMFVLVSGAMVYWGRRK